MDMPYPLDHVQPPMHLASVRVLAVVPALQKLARRGDKPLRVETDFMVSHVYRALVSIERCARMLVL
eukprot:3331350-Alexandrium_andersonii.AAC.1